jgi:hypothetical protein
VTSIVKPTIDAAPPGLVNLTVTDGGISSNRVEGVALAVIFDDPSTLTDQTLVLFFGAQSISGDTFAVGLADPIDLTDPNLHLDFSLGISFGFQGVGATNQVSLVNVNGQRLTSSAGGQDDGANANGALITVGGIGDTNGNPSPFAAPSGTNSNPTGAGSVARSDDELYNLIPFVHTGDTSLSIFTINPSNDDNIFFAALRLSGTALVGEGILLSPTFAENPTGSVHTVTAKVQDDAGHPVVGRSVDFSILTGPHAGLAASDTTDASGEATFSYTGTTAGNDVIVARFKDSAGVIQTSNQAIKRWIQVNTAPTCAEDFTDARTNFLEPNPESFVVTEGSEFRVPITLDDVDGDIVTASLSGPAGAVLGPPTSGAAPFTTDFVWTPTAAQKVLAPYLIVVTVTDAHGASSTCSFTVEDINLDPSCNAGGDQNGQIMVECASHDGTLVQLHGTATDPDDTSLNYHWDVSDLAVILDDPDSTDPSGLFPVGVTMATLTVTDGRGGLCICDVIITVVDSIPPEVECTSDLAMMWPPNHKMWTVELVVLATDACSDPSLIDPLTVTVRSSEPDDASGAGDGQTTGDVNGSDGFTAPVDITPLMIFDNATQTYTTTLQLRAERDGTGSGRKYTIDVAARDSHGNVGKASCCIVVPHDKRPNANN